MVKALCAIVGLAIGLVVGYLYGSLSSTFVVVSSDPNSGRFLGTPEAIWLDGGRDMKLLKDFVFIDSRGRSWIAEKDRVVNGASIPQFLWSIVGGPFEGQYRNASIVHDAECEKMTSPSTDVHRMFYDACRAGGVKEKDAKYLYWAVANYGPSWTIRNVVTVAAPPNPDGASMTSSPPTLSTSRDEIKMPTTEELEWAKAFFEHENPSVEQVPFLRPPTRDSESALRPNVGIVRSCELDVRPVPLAFQIDAGRSANRKGYTLPNRRLCAHTPDTKHSFPR